MRFATRVLLLQLLTVVAVVTTSTVVFIGLSIEQLRDEAETSALMIARTIGSDPQVRELVAEETQDAENPAAEVLAQGEIQHYAEAAADSTSALFVVITDNNGMRLAHPDEDLLGLQVSTSFAEALAGKEVVAWEKGTLGESARAKVPVFAPDSETPVGEISVGFERNGVFDDLPRTLLFIVAAALLALLIGIIAMFVLRKRWEQLTLGVQPEELVVMVQNQAAVLDGVGDGVIALDTEGTIRLSNGSAKQIFGLHSAEGRSLTDLGLPDDVVADLQAGVARDGIVANGRVLFLEARSVDRGGQSLGAVIVIRDRTDVMALSERLETVRTMTSALRVQRHEFANRMHVAAGLIESGRDGEAAQFLRAMRSRGPVDYPLIGTELISEPFLQAFLGAKSLEASERGVSMQIREETLVLGKVAEVEDIATVLGNLVDNAITAAVANPEMRLVEVTLMDDATELVMVVADSGPGITPGEDPFAHKTHVEETEQGEEVVPAEQIRGRGIGLTLSQEMAQRRGGEVWVIERGGEPSGRGAVFGARLPGVMEQDPSFNYREVREEEGK
ncbi:sensor histidine kinase [Corynebacterium ammoniagenes]|uniref:Sensor-like histidine kinase SenX3 n=1 Tax=Corynebacterium ammoniagenes DSM 20306 TaxID=649754 RepID=A0ABP2IBX6_CORAM|nr:sensor histidine kinase [Corynebacterium ammoniagenes]APT81793.1 histidine kinase [Corynebacterium ammoniagenes DSM 20306]AQS72910.1 histidine kinase [Corynebacterium ammoniagenes]EFG81058.1 ATPase/histidine kinase/DNA gyrase B/HSP90 domain protein [Corynebacterium ammoniagenes DSM 20306]